MLFLLSIKKKAKKKQAETSWAVIGGYIRLSDAFHKGRMSYMCFGLGKMVGQFLSNVQ